MSIQQQLQEAESIDIDNLSEKIAKETIPGGNNDRFLEGIGNAVGVVPMVIEDLNNWFEIVDIRILGNDHIGIPMRYRWTIIRWAKQDMDSWLMDNGWQDMAHLNADSRTREEDELEARYRKSFGGVTVDANFLVHFPPKVFEELNNQTIEEMKKEKERHKQKETTLSEIIERRRNNG